MLSLAQEALSNLSITRINIEPNLDFDFIIRSLKTLSSAYLSG